MIATVKCAGECLVTSAPPLRSPAGARGGVDRFIKPDLHVPPRAGLGRETDNQLHVSVSLSSLQGARGRQSGSAGPVGLLRLEDGYGPSGDCE